MASFFVVSGAGLVKAGILGTSSQTIGLAPSLPPNLMATGGGDITINQNALLPDAGVLGTMVDIGNTLQSDEISLYVVRPGDSLSTIAEMFGVSVNTIVWANDLSRKSVLQPGQTLVILPVSGIQHRVARGETLESIARKYGGDIDEIIQFNELSSASALAAGDVIIIPDGEEAAPPVVPGQAPSRVRGAGGPDYVGYYLRPIAGGMKTQGLHGYNGVDLADTRGTLIVAAADGVVIVSKTGGWNGGYGNYVVIKHDNGTQTLYAHNEKNIVAMGQSVVQGQVIAYLGSTGKSTGPHVHFEVRGAKNPF